MYSLRRARERRWLSRIRADDVTWSVWGVVSRQLVCQMSFNIVE